MSILDQDKCPASLWWDVLMFTMRSHQKLDDWEMLGLTCIFATLMSTDLTYSMT